MKPYAYLHNNDACEYRAPAGKIVFSALLLLLLACLPKLSFAASSCTNRLSVTITASGVAFNNYNPLASAPTTGTGTVTVSATCKRANLPFTVNYTTALSTGSSNTYAARTIKYGTNPALNYNLYTTAGLGIVWGNGSGSTQTVPDTINGTCQRTNRPGTVGRTCSGSQSDTVYGNIPGRQNVIPGPYSDTITVTVTF